VARNPLRQSACNALADGIVECKGLLIANEGNNISGAVENSLAMPATLKVELKPRLHLGIHIIINIIGDLAPHFDAADLYDDPFIRHLGLPFSSCEPFRMA